MAHPGTMNGQVPSWQKCQGADFFFAPIRASSHHPHECEQLEAFPMKKLINTPERLVDEELAGMALAHADLIRVEEPNIIVRRDAPRKGKVGVISGGGSGHRSGGSSSHRDD